MSSAEPQCIHRSGCVYATACHQAGHCTSTTHTPPSSNPISLTEQIAYIDGELLDWSEGVAMGGGTGVLALENLKNDPTLQRACSKVDMYAAILASLRRLSDETTDDAREITHLPRTGVWRIGGKVVSEDEGKAAMQAALTSPHEPKVGDEVTLAPIPACPWIPQEGWEITRIQRETLVRYYVRSRIDPNYSHVYVPRDQFTVKTVAETKPPRTLSSVERLHNLCDALSEQADESPFTREEWNRIDAQTVAVQNAARALLDKMETVRSLPYHAPAWESEANALRALVGRVKPLPEKTSSSLDGAYKPECTPAKATSAQAGQSPSAAQPPDGVPLDKREHQQP